MDSMYDVLLQLPLFQGVSRMKMSEIIEKTRFHFLKYQDNEIIAHRGEECTHMKFIVSGSARSELKNISGKIRVSETLHAPNILYPNHLFGRNHHLPLRSNRQRKLRNHADRQTIVCQPHSTKSHIHYQLAEYSFSAFTKEPRNFLGPLFGQCQGKAGILDSELHATQRHRRTDHLQTERPLYFLRRATVGFHDSPQRTERGRNHLLLSTRHTATQPP